MTKQTVRIGAATGACAVAGGIVIGALTLGGQSTATASAEPVEPTATYQTTQLAPTTPVVAVATPEITGPAPLPVEDQGLPG